MVIYTIIYLLGFQIIRNVPIQAHFSRFILLRVFYRNCYIFYNDIPDLFTIVGAVIITLSGIFVLNQSTKS